MRVLMISLDKTLLGADYSGDVLERHREYAQRAGHLDIVVFSKKRFKKREIDKYLTIYPTNSLSKFYYIRDACRITKREGKTIDLIVTQDPFLTGLAGWKIKKRLRIPLLIHFHGDFWHNRYWLREKWYNLILLFLSKILVKKADRIRVVSSGIKEKLVKAGIEKNKIRVIPTPVDLEKFERFNEEKVKNFRRQYKNKKIIINVGRNDPSKDYQTLFETIKILSERYGELAFWQIGANFQTTEKNISLVGKISQEELINYYHASDIYVSSSCHESFGKVLVEAMTCGLPVVATVTTGSKEIVRDGINGFLVPIGNSRALAEKVLYLLNNPEKAKQMGENGRRMVKEKFNQEKNIQEIIEFWQELSKMI